MVNVKQEVRLALITNDNKIIPTYPGPDPTSHYIRFPPSLNFALHLSLPQDFHFLADVLVLTVTVNGDVLSTFHIQRLEGEEDGGGEGRGVLEGIIRSSRLMFPGEGFDHGQVLARLVHARRGRRVSPQAGGGEGEGRWDDVSAPLPLAQVGSEVEKQKKTAIEGVPSSSSDPEDGVTVTPLAYPEEQQVFTFKWNFRSQEGLSKVVSVPRVGTGPAWTEEDEAYVRRQNGMVGREGRREGDDFLVRREAEAEAEEKGRDRGGYESEW